MGSSNRAVLIVDETDQKLTLTTVGSDVGLDVNVIGGSTNNTEYTEGATDSTITGLAILHEGSSDTLQTVSSSTPLPVEIVDTSFAVADGNALGEGVLVPGDDGTDRKNINVDATTGDVQVDVTNTVTVTATNLDVQSGGADMSTSAQTAAIQTAVEIMDDWDNAASDGASVSGDVAHDAADAGEPVKIGGRAQVPTAQLEEVADNDRADGAFDRQGRLAVWLGYPVQTAIINDSTNGNNTIQAAAGAGLRIAVMGYHIVSDGTTDVRWEDGAGGTAFTGQIPLQAREGIVAGYGMHPMWVGAADTLLNLELTANIVVHGQVSFIVMTD